MVTVTNRPGELRTVSWTDEEAKQLSEEELTPANIRKMWLLLILWSVGWVTFYALIGVAIWVYWAEIYLALAELIDLNRRSYSKTILLCVCGMTAAGVLYYLRSKAKAHYGRLEVAFGLVSIGSLAWPAPGDNSRIQLIQLAASVYILVRGLDNVAVGIEEAERKSEASIKAKTAIRASVSDQ